MEQTIETIEYPVTLLKDHRYHDDHKAGENILIQEVHLKEMLDQGTVRFYHNPFLPFPGTVAWDIEAQLWITSGGAIPCSDHINWFLLKYWNLTPKQYNLLSKGEQGEIGSYYSAEYLGC